MALNINMLKEGIKMDNFELNFEGDSKKKLRFETFKNGLKKMGFSITDITQDDCFMCCFETELKAGSKIDFDELAALLEMTWYEITCAAPPQNEIKSFYFEFREIYKFTDYIEQWRNSFPEIRK